MNSICIKDFVGVLPGNIGNLTKIPAGKVLDPGLFDLVLLQSQGVRMVELTPELQALVDVSDRRPGDISAAAIMTALTLAGDGLQAAYNNVQAIEMLAATGDLVINAVDAVAFRVLKGGSSVIEMDAAGAVTATSSSGQNTRLRSMGVGNARLDALGTGNAVVNAAGGQVQLVSGGGTRLVANADGAVDITPATDEDFTVATAGDGAAKFTTLKSGTLIAPPGGLVSGELWEDTTDSAAHPIVRIAA